MTASDCCKIQKKKTRTLADERPDLDFDYLLDESNINTIKENIRNRKGIGNIDALHKVWKEIQDYSGKKNKSEEEYTELWQKLYVEALALPNQSPNDVPIGGEEANVTVGTYGDKREEDGLHIAENLVAGWKSVHYPRESAGSRAYAFCGAVANVEAALLQYAMETVKELKPDVNVVEVPDILPLTTTEACGVHPKSVDNHTLQYLVQQDSHMALSGTAEMGIAHVLRNRTFKEARPHWFMAKSKCYRPEISHSASEAKLYRVHEFNKVEMFVVCNSDDSERCLDEIVSIQRKIFDGLSFHYRVLNMASQELGAAAAKKFDIEAWMPGRGYYGEVSSASNCTDYQSRRLGIKLRQQDGTTEYAHTCNGTAISSSRALITVLETHQDKARKGWKCPQVLKKYIPEGRSLPFSFKQAAKFTYDD
ncbi:unnamed protein product [Bursaphelenchus okinawaensis]|uniref:serine--tRNA ligase n=1 Tax=Bursaphelenchus okinawaensis TaxID=465554 RepID=A0A811KXE4_9BILA|nr:unnamed protein product [Bursaphelenchus okinawaensis]CAG9112647.1 unnamed protein product [Bursaphelenchus okinawaensis]